MQIFGSVSSNMYPTILRHTNPIADITVDIHWRIRIYRSIFNWELTRNSSATKGCIDKEKVSSYQYASENSGSIISDNKILLCSALYGLRINELNATEAGEISAFLDFWEFSEKWYREVPRLHLITIDRLTNKCRGEIKRHTKNSIGIGAAQNDY